MFRWHRVLFLAAITVASASPSFAVTRQLTYPDPNFADGTPVYSPSGARVAFSRYRQSPFFILPTVFVADVATGAVDSLVTDLPAGWAGNGGLAWSPDGRQIAFSADKGTGGPSAVWIADVPGPVVPRIVATCINSNGTYHLALDSNGVVYFFGGVTPRCSGSGLSISIKGNMFGGGPPSSPVVAMEVGDGIGGSGQIVTTLQNGDVWQLCEGAGDGEYVGNVFIAAGVTAVGLNAPRVQNQVALARPNPFNPSVTIPYTVAAAGKVSLRVFDVSGRLVRTLEDVNRLPGQYTARWDGNADGGAPSASGTYFCQIHFADGTKSEQKLTVLK